jgi:uncharacterized SAM-binding protein YcdF (DUF218 family)
MQCLRRCLVAFLAVSAALAALAGGAALIAADWLDDPDAPRKAGAIVILGGDATRGLEAADLYRAGLAPKIYFSVPIREAREKRLDALGVITPTSEELIRRVLAVRGVPENVAEPLAQDMVTTVDEAKAAAERLTGVPGPLLVVTSPYHIRRARMIFHDAMPDRQLVFIASPYEQFPHAWWTDQVAARNVVLELAKTVYYLAGGRF